MRGRRALITSSAARPDQVDRCGKDRGTSAEELRAQTPTSRTANGVPGVTDRLARLKEGPHVNAIAAIHSPNTAIVDSRRGGASPVTS